MQYWDKNGAVAHDISFFQRVREASQTNIAPCYQCLTCSLSCPVAFAMDYLPNQIIRMVQLGLKERTLSSSTIWICAGCETCVARCPNEVDILRLMDTLREMSLQEGFASQTTITAFNHAFLNSIKRWGRQHELPMLLQFKLKTRDFFSDLDLGVKMMLKGKLKLLPPHFKDSAAVRAIFEKTARLAGGKKT